MKNILVVLFFFLCLGVTAQEQRGAVQFSRADLSTVLVSLEKQYNVKFSYAPSLVDNTIITLSLTDVSLQTVLSKVEEQSTIIFDKIDERYYILKVKKTTTICGYLKDENGLIEGASVRINNSNKGTITNAKGFFEIDEVKLIDTISISFLGYETLEVPVVDFKSETCNTYYLSPQNFILNEVVVQEYLAAGILKLQDGGVRITPNNLEILGGLSEPDVLQNTQLLPGIESPSETASGLFVRGSTPDQNLILWDGIKMYNSDHFFGMLSAFNPYIVKEVNVYRSGTKVQYGDRVSGVVDITTDDKIASKPKGGFGFNGTHLDGFLKLPISDKVGVQVSARRAVTDVFNTPTFSRLSDKVFQNTSIYQNQTIYEPEYTNSKENFYFADASFKLIAKVSGKDKITVSSLFTRNQLDYSFSDVEFADTSSDKLEVQNLGAVTSWERLWNNRFSSKAQIYYSNYDLTYYGFNQFVDQQYTVSKKNSIKELGFSFHTDLKVNEALRFSSGYQFFNNQLSYTLNDADVEEGDDESNVTHAIYNQLNYQPKNWYIDLGLRSSYYSGVSQLFLEPRLYVEKNINDAIRLKASAELKNQGVSQILEFATLDFGLENQIWVLAKQDEIPVLRSNQISGGFLFFADGWNLDVEGYYKAVNGLTSLTRGFELAENNFAKGSSTTFGIDVLLKKKWGNYSSWLGYTYSTTNLTFDTLNNGNAFRGNNDITNSLSWSHFYKWNKIQFSMGWRYRTGIPYTAVLGTTGTGDDIEVNYDSTNAKTLPDYHRMDVSMLYDFKFSKKDDGVTGKVGFSLLNVYGRENVLGKSYQLYSVADEQGGTSTELREVTKYSLGATPNLVFRLNF